MANEDLSGSRSISQRLVRAVQLQASANAPYACARPTNFIAYLFELLARGIEIWESFLVTIHTA